MLATLSRPGSSAKSVTDDPRADLRYALGVLMMTASLFLTGALGLLQERTYSVYGPYWREGVFYTVSSISFARICQLTLLSS